MARTDYFSGHNLALQRAVDADAPQAAEQLLNAGADPNARERQINGTILEYAVAQQRNKVIPVLLRHGADPALRDNANANAVTMASDLWYKDHEPLKLLLAAGADPDTRDEEGDPILNNALSLKQSDAVDLLIQYHANVNALTAGNYNPKKLAQGQSKVTAPDGIPLILRQARSDDWDMVYKLLEAGAKFDYPNSDDSMPEWYNPQFADVPGVGSLMYQYKVKCWKFMTERGLKLPPFAGMK